MTIDAPNEWRLETPGHAGWERTARPQDPNKYFMVSCDSHTNEPADLWRERLKRSIETVSLGLRSMRTA